MCHYMIYELGISSLNGVNVCFGPAHKSRHVTDVMLQCFESICQVTIASPTLLCNSSVHETAIKVSKHQQLAVRRIHCAQVTLLGPHTLYYVAMGILSWGGTLV